MSKNILLCVGITILFLGTCITPSVAIDTPKESSIPISNGNILYVGGTGPNNYTKIQDAINDSSDGDTVFVYAYSSPYYEHVLVVKSINLIGEDKNTTVIDGEGRGTVIRNYADFVKISDFKIIKGIGNKSFCGIFNSGRNTIITGNIFSSNYYGVNFKSENCLFKNNILTRCYYGIRIASNNTLTEVPLI